MNHTVILFYKYTPIENPQELMFSQKAIAKKLGLTGRMIIAEEGINATFEGANKAIQAYTADLTNDSRFKDIHFKKSAGNGSSFPKLSIKVRDEIVSAHLNEDDVKPWQITGKRLSPDDLHKLYEQNEDFVIVDMRNNYEYQSGHFKESLNSNMENFRDLPKTTKAISNLKDKKIVTVCTGGVRCEKASGYLVSKGFKDVYQLDGGIVSYMEKYPTGHFKGSLYVFDGRVTMATAPAEVRGIVGKCKHCGKATEHYENCANNFCHFHFMICEDCVNNLGAFCSKKCKVIEARKNISSWFMNFGAFSKLLKKKLLK